MQIFISLFATCVIVFPIYLISTAISSSKKRKETAKQKAISRGHVVTAVLKKTTISQRNVPGTYKNWASMGIYEYKYNGKNYKYQFWSNTPPATLTLYFISNPKKATVEKALSDSKVCWPLVYVIVATIVYLVVRN